MFDTCKSARRATLLAIAATAFSCSIAALGGSATAATTGGVVASCAPISHAGHFTAAIREGQSTRTALVYAPPAAAEGRRLPLVFAFHGAGGTGRFMESYTDLSRVAKRYGFFAVYPNALHKYWQLATPKFVPDDITFVQLLLDQLDRQLCVDDSRVYATGVSNGGGFTARLGCDLSSRLAAIAPVAGDYAYLPPCQPVRPISVLEVHGTKDESVPYDASGPGRRTNVTPFLNQWAFFDSCPSAAPLYRHLGPGALLLDRPHCALGTSVAHIQLSGGTHVWPGTRYIRRGRSTGPPLSTSEAIWRFFQAHGEPPLAQR